jgi:hypothetical protein
MTYSAQQQSKWEAELVARYGPQASEHIAESKRRMATMSAADGEALAELLVDIEKRIIGCIEQELAPDDLLVQALIHEHYLWVNRFWTPNSESYAGLADLYNDSPEFLARYDAIDVRLAPYLREAMYIYALGL